jgi:RHS repeat-associated protein
MSCRQGSWPLLWSVCVQVRQWPCACARGCKRHDKKNLRKGGACVGMARVFPYLGLSKKMGCLKLTYHEETELPIFLSVWKKSDALEKSTNYQSWGGVLREQKWVDLDVKYRYGYQGKYAEKDDETGWDHFELREYDPIIGRWFQTDPEGQFFSPYVGMSNDPVNGTDPDGGWVKGAGFFNNLFKSDSRIHAERYASSWSSSTSDYYAAKAGDAWGVYSVDKTSIGCLGSGCETYQSFTPVNKDGSLGEVDGAFIRSTPSPGNIDFDPLTQLSLGFMVTGSSSAGGASAVSRPLFHYTTEAGFNAIMKSKVLNPSIGLKNARFGVGQYFTDIAPGVLTRGQTSYRLYGVPWNNARLTHFIKIETSGLNIIKNKPFNFLNPSSAPLKLNGRILGGGQSVFK